MIESQVIFQSVDLSEPISCAPGFVCIPLLFREFFAMGSSSIPARLKFAFERLARNHIDEWLLIGAPSGIRRGDS